MQVGKLGADDWPDLYIRYVHTVHEQSRVASRSVWRSMGEMGESGREGGKVVPHAWREKDWMTKM